jgi:hypothetical protein
MSAVLLILILLGVAGAGFYFYSRSYAAEGEEALIPQDGQVRKLESERWEDRSFDRLTIDDVVVFDGRDRQVRGILTYRSGESREADEPRAIEYLLEVSSESESEGQDGSTGGERQWLWVEARGDVALEIRREIDAGELASKFASVPPDGAVGEEISATDVPDSLEWEETAYSLQDTETAERTAQGETDARSTGRVTYFHYANGDGDVVFVERLGDDTRVYVGRRVAKYELELL